MRRLERKVLSEVCCRLRIFLSIAAFSLATAIVVVPFFVYNFTRSITKVSNTSIHRLSTNIIPSHYRLYIDASQLEELVFQGTLDIDIQIKKITAEIILNSVNLNITEVGFQDHKFTSIVLNGSVEFNREYEQAIIKFHQQLNPGNGRLYLSFNGKINDQLNGFYRTQSDNFLGACTQFEPGYARQAFPCFDEPSFKANFTITIRSHKNLTTLSNMPVKSKSNGGNDTYVYEFETTPIMSTYLVAYVIGHYDYIETRDSNNVLIRVYTPIGKQKQGSFALKTAAKMLPFYADYFGIKYPLSKLDMVAVSDFGSGAMENWGLVTYRETYLLVNGHTSPQKTKQDVSLVVAHELAHQWFGNLVTMQWWNDLWLNEDKYRPNTLLCMFVSSSFLSFATWIEFLAVDYVYPEFDIWTQFVSDTLATCMVPDALHNSHPIEMPIEKPTEIDEIFDEITYGKGSSVIRLIHGYIGSEAFRRGLSNYLAEYSYKNTITDNLWSHLSRASNNSHLSSILSTWTKQMGYPLLTVKEKQRGNERLITIEQIRFLADGTKDDSLRWKIPIDICTKSSPNESVYQLYLNGEKKQEFLLEKIPSTDWIKLNLFSVGIYRVDYPQSMLEALTPGIDDQTLSPQDRFNIQADVFALARAGQKGYVDYLKLLRQAYKHEENLTVWKSILRQLSDLGSIFEYAYLNNTKLLYRSYVCDLLLNIYNKLTWDPLPNESSQAIILRSIILLHMGVNEHDKTRDEAAARFEKIFIHSNEDNFMDPNIRGAVYLTVAKTGNQRTFDQLKSLYMKSDAQEERLILLNALSHFDDESLQYKALDFLWNTTLVRKQDHLSAFSSLAAHNRRGSEICWMYMQENWKKIVQLYGEHDSHLIHYIENIPGLFASVERSEEVRKFYIAHPNPFLDRSIKKVLEQINIRRLVLERHEQSINQFLSVRLIKKRFSRL
ncbi:unnamed protein product [Rotaria socialis]|uniref:Aminopeptidase n=1 Tax=Rotaria socialis TaxID=392032 RepID=A0A817MDQ9_9BILA|nr:unnamed protein product [Rotaria socialis]CAF4378137.1 unnamed protein product [Rotaria socialis]